MATPTDSSLRTGWVAIATEGESIDGRLITAQWIADMAETYDPEFYCAQLWPEHIHYGENAGHVQALKTDVVNGKQTLFGILSPTRDLIYQNGRGQMKFCSIEPWENFAGTGKTYLFGLGVTDLPASTGTTMLKFSAKHPNRLVGHSMPLDLSDFTAEPQASERPNLAQQFFRFLAGHGDAPASTRQEPHTVLDEETDDMKDEQFTALNDTLTGLGAAVASFSTMLDALGKDAPTNDPDKPDAKDKQGGDDNKADDGAQFTALNDTLKGLGEKFDTLNQKIDAFSAEVPGQRPGALGGKDTKLKAF